MSEPGFPTVMSFFLSQCEKEAIWTSVCAWLPMSYLSTYGKVKRRGFNICLPTYRKVKKAGVTYVCTFLPSLKCLFCLSFAK